MREFLFLVHVVLDVLVRLSHFACESLLVLVLVGGIFLIEEGAHPQGLQVLMEERAAFGWLTLLVVSLLDLLVLAGGLLLKREISLGRSSLLLVLEH